MKRNKFLDKYINLANEYKPKLQLILVCNVEGLTVDKDDYSGDSITSEYLTLQQYNKILSSLRQEGFDVISYFDETEFMSDVLTKKCEKMHGQELLVINSAQKGTKVGRKSLIPAFCDLHHIYYNNSNAYVVSLCRDKYNSGCLLENWGFPVPESWLYRYNQGWVLNAKPPIDEKIILKLNYETSSIGLDKNNIYNYDESKDSLIDIISHKYKQDVIIQKFIYGYEVEVSFIYGKGTFVFPPVGIKLGDNKTLGDKILDYDIRKNHPYEFYDFMQECPETAPKIQECTKYIASALNISGLGRIDYRITPQQQYFVTDVATNPGYGDFSSTYHVFKTFGYSYCEMLTALVGIALDKYIQ